MSEVTTTPDKEQHMNARHNRTTLVLGTMAGAVSAWGWFSLMTHSAHAPWPIAILSIACLELFVVSMAVHANHVANDGDSPAPYTLLITVVAVLAMTLQFFAALSEGWGWIVGILLAMAPAAAIVSWVAHIRRVFRLRGRAAGTVAQPAAAIELSVWVRNFKAAWAGKGMAVLDRTLSPKDAVLLGIRATEPKPKLEIEPPARVDRGLRYEDIVPTMRTVVEASPALNGTRGH